MTTDLLDESEIESMLAEAVKDAQADSNLYFNHSY